MDTINRLISETVPELPDVPIERIREFVLQNANDLSTVILANAAVAKQALQTHFKPVVLTPKQTNDGPLFTVQGTFDLFSGVPDVMQLVPRGGLEPPRPVKVCGF